MNDMISRQAALDALGEEPPVWYDGDDEIAERNQWRRDVAALKALPSAQPDVPDTNVGDMISRQGVLRLLNAVPSEEFATKAMLISGVNALPPAQGWIPISEKLPEMTDTYLVQVGINENGEGMHTEVRTADWNVVWHEWYVHTTRCLVGDIIKWMPIPWEGGQE